MLPVSPIIATMSALRVGVVGCGAAGLVALHVFSQEEHNVDCVVFEKNSYVGGVWKYDKTSSPMYRSLVTNLPKEIMQIGEAFPFDAKVEHSFVSHEEVQRYLEEFSEKNDLKKRCQFNTPVQRVHKLSNGQWQIVSGDGSNVPITEEIFDRVVICNGHYSVPQMLSVPGISNFKGKIFHASEYDTDVGPSVAGLVVAVIGTRSSGTDIAREIHPFAGRVIVCDRSRSVSEDTEIPNLSLHPAIDFVDEDGNVVFVDGSRVTVDVLIFATGYQYSLPFLRASDDTAGVFVEAGRQVKGLYEQLFAVDDPTICFVGLPFSVVPFPLFYVQCQLAAAVFQQRVALPDLPSRQAWYRANEAKNLGDSRYHYLGENQWDYLRRLRSLLAQGHPEAAGRNRYLELVEAIYNDNSRRRPKFCGAPDTYRQVKYTVHKNDDPSDDSLKWEASP